jgi:hypothetical protein
MRNKNLRKALVLLSVTFICFCLVEERVFAKTVDSADVKIISKGVYPGRFTELQVMLKNPMAIAGFQFLINASNPDLFNFHTDSVRWVLDTIPVDTCTWEPESLHYQHPECYVDSLALNAVRYIRIDTVGSLISGFSPIQCHGELGDTNSPSCKWLTVMGFTTDTSEIIKPYPNYRTLFELGVDIFCIPDSTTDRSVSFYIVSGTNSYLSDPQGHLVPFRSHDGSFTLVSSRPGDVSGDSAVGLGDVVYLITYLYKGGPPPCIPEAADVTGDCVVGLGDVVYLITYQYKGGPPPLPGCWHGKKEE